MALDGKKIDVWGEVFIEGGGLDNEYVSRIGVVSGEVGSSRGIAAISALLAVRGNMVV